MGNNSGLNNTIDGLKMNCNDFTSSANLYDIALDLGSNSVAPSVMKEQGNVIAPTATNVVRNMYAATCIGNNQNKWFIDASSNKQIDHGCNNTAANGAITKPSPQPACSRTIVNTATISTVLNYTYDCPGTTASSGGGGTNQAQRLTIMNDYLTGLKTDNVDNVNHFEIQATVASKLNLFLTDSLNEGLDSSLVILETNQGNMHDADIQSVFASINKGDFTAAQNKVNELNEGRTDWATLLTKLISVEQNTVNGIYSLNENEEDRDFFIDYANSEGKDGQSIAQALLEAACNHTYTEPHNYPETEGAQRQFKHQAQPGEQNLLTQNDKIEVYPNPTANGVHIQYVSSSESEVLIVVKDLLGRVIFTKFINGTNNQFVPMDHLNNGMYLITMTRENKTLYNTKIVKQN